MLSPESNDALNVSRIAPVPEPLTCAAPSLSKISANTFSTMLVCCGRPKGEATPKSPKDKNCSPEKCLLIFSTSLNCNCLASSIIKYGITECLYFKKEFSAVIYKHLLKQMHL